MLLIVAQDKRSIKYLLENVIIENIEQIGNVTLYTLSHKTYKFMLVVTGYCKVNISRAVTLAIKKQSITDILCIGTIGHLDVCKPQIFSVIIANETFQFDVNFTAVDEPITKLPAMEKATFRANDELVKIAKLATKSNSLKCHVGKVASGDRFVADTYLAYCLRMIFNASGVDTDSGAVGEIAYLNDIPYVSVKVISNNCANDAGTQQKSYEAEAIESCQKIALSFLEQIQK